MESSVKVVALDRTGGPLLAVAVGEVNTHLPSSLLGLDAAVDGALERLIAHGDFTGKRDQTALVYPRKGPERLLLVGLGPGSQITRGEIRRAAAIAGRKAAALGVTRMAFHVAHETHGGVPVEAVGQVSVEGIWQGAWQFRQLKAVDDEREPLAQLDLIAAREERAELDRGARVGHAIAVGQRLARNLQALPGNICTPSYLADIARRLGRAYKFKVTVLGAAQLQKDGFGGLLGVARGSHEEPKFIVLEHKRAGRDAPICLVGKGVTFDAGGISIKPAQSMEEMKYDMSGAAAVLGAFEAIGQLRPAVNVVGLVPTTENLPSGTALKPGDIITSHLGKTIEVINTDAEGRLILADALSYARKFKPAAVVDAATLTGAVVIALGHHAAGLLGNDDALLEEVRRAGDRAGERCWPLPLWDEYREQIKSDVADVKNTGGRPAGTITAGWFLREFVEFPWAHVDIAGTAYIDSDRPDLAKGPTGVGARLFAELILARRRG